MSVDDELPPVLPSESPPAEGRPGEEPPSERTSRDLAEARQAPDGAEGRASGAGSTTAAGPDLEPGADEAPAADDDGPSAAVIPPEPGLGDRSDWNLPPTDGPAPSGFLLPFGTIAVGAWLLRWAAAAWREAPTLWWDVALAALAGLGLLALGLPRLRSALRELGAFWSSLRREPMAVNREGAAVAASLAAGAVEGASDEDGRTRPAADEDEAQAVQAAEQASPGRDLRSRLAGLGAGLRRPVEEGPWLPVIEAVSARRLTLACGLGAIATSLALITQQRLDALAFTIGVEQVPHLDRTLLLVLLLTLALAASMELLAPEAVPDPALGAVPAVYAGGLGSWLLAAGGLGLALIPAAFSARTGDAPPPYALLRPMPEFQNATLQPLGLLLWLLGLTLLITALREPGRGPLEVAGGWLGALRRPEAWLLLGILGLGAYLRFHDLLNLPAEMTSDHTEKLNDVRTMLEGGLRPVFLPGNAGREAMEFYWLAFLMGPLGLPVSFQTMKLGMGLVSLLNVALIYRLGRELGGRALALAAAFLLAVAPWHLLITRIALRIAFAPLWVTIVAWLLLRAMRSGHRNDWLALGGAAALGVYGYTAYRAFVLVVPAIVVAKLLHDRWVHRHEAPRWLPAGLPSHLLAALLLALVLALPILRYSRDYPEYFNHRSVTRLVGDQPLEGAAFDQALDQNLRTQLWPNIERALWMFNLTSDGAWFQSPPGRPALDTVAGALFLLGLALVLVRGWRRDWRYLSLALAIPLMLATSFMAIAFPRENPSLSRASGALPLVIVIAALPLPGLVARWRAALGRRGLAGATVVVAGLLAWMVAGSWQRYFVEYRQIYDQSTHNTSEGAAAVRRFLEQDGADISHVYYVGWENGWDFRALAYLLGEPSWNGLLGGQKPDWSDAATAAQPQVADPAPKLYLVGGPFAQAQLDTLKGYFPDARVEQQPSRVPGKEFWTVTVPPRGGGASR